MPGTEPDRQREVRPFSVLFLVALVLFLAAETVPLVLSIFGFPSPELRLGLIVLTTVVTITAALTSPVSAGRRVGGALLALAYPLLGLVVVLLLSGDLSSWFTATFVVASFAPATMSLSWMIARRLHPLSLLALLMGVVVFLILAVVSFLFMLAGDEGGYILAAALPILEMVGFALLFDRAARRRAQGRAARWPSPAPYAQ